MQTSPQSGAEAPAPEPWARPGYNLVATLGVYGSASTWVFNVLRELAAVHYGAENVHAVFSDSVQKVLEDPKARDRHLVWKLHRGDKSWAMFAALSRARVILTLRDPRDATLSMMQRFGSTWDIACGAVVIALRAIAEASAAGHPGLRYEDRFFDKPQTVGAVAAHVGLPVDRAQQERIFAAYTTDRVREFGRAFDDLPSSRIKRVGDQTSYDEVTQIHRRHIGDQRIGKWRDVFDTEQKKLLNLRFAPYLRAFGYDLE